MNIKINGLCPECFNKDIIIINEVYKYCSRCGLELETPEPILNKKQYYTNYFKDLKRYEKHKDKNRLVSV